MKTNKSGRFRSLAAFVAMACAIPASYAQQQFSWATIVNNGVLVPGTTLNFNSYNQPAVNSAGLVAFRARGRVLMSGEGEETLAAVGAPAEDMVTSGVWMRDMGTLGPVTTVVQRGHTVPQPNNTTYQGALAAFIEFPSSARIDDSSSLIVTRGQHTPAYTYLLADGVSESRVGQNGVYASIGAGMVTAAGLYGAVREGATQTQTFPHFAVPDPGLALPTRFDVFAGAPAATGGTKAAFKGNWTDLTDPLLPEGYTGVYYRDITGTSPTTLIASSYSTLVPNGNGTTKFGATAAPSAAGGYVAFTGWDIELAPTMGGIYRAPIAPMPALQTLAAIGAQVPGEAAGRTFRNFGEGLSISEDGRYVAFWGTWGLETIPKILYCPIDGQAELLAYCNATYPAGFPVEVPVYQGIFVADAEAGTVIPIAKTTQDGITDFLYWGFSGMPPGVGGGGAGGEEVLPAEDDEAEAAELPRWRSAAFAALAGKVGALYGSPAAPSPYQVAFKAARYGVDGIYLRQGSAATANLETVVETLNWPGQTIDLQAPAGSIVSAVGIERDGFRHENLAITVSMLFETADESLGWAGLYLAKVHQVQAGDLAAEPRSLAFPEVPINTNSAPLQVVITNYWDVPSAVNGVAVVGAFYTITENNCPATLAAHASCTISVVFSPTTLGSHSATLAVNGSALTVPLTGSGTFTQSPPTNVTALITSYYGTLFARLPDVGGLDYWTAEYQRLLALGVDPKEVFYALARAMLSSPEYLARNSSDASFLTDLYETFMLREPDPSGMSYWLRQIANGLDRNVIVNAFIFSAEYTASLSSVFGTSDPVRPEFSVVTDLYRGFLNRLPDSPGFAYWLAYWQTAQCAGPAAVAEAAESVSVQFITSAEFWARVQAQPGASQTRTIVASFYDAFLRRAADAEGFNFWIAQIESGAQTLDDARRAFIASPEFQARINVIGAAGCIN